MFKKSALKILFVATEAAPFAKVGGLGSVMYSLPIAIKRQGHDARVMIPRYGIIDSAAYKLTMEKEGLIVPTGNAGEKNEILCNVKKYTPDPKKSEHPVTTYFLENQEYYEQRTNVYGYGDDPVRWALFCKGILEFLKVSEWQPDVIACSDWPTGFLPNYLYVDYANDPILSKITTTFIIHNLYHQGIFDHKFVQEEDRDEGHDALPSFDNPKLLKANGMRRGIMYADVISTVSATYAEEILTPEYGEQLEELLAKRRTVLHGILNGIDYEMWNPEKDSLLPHRFSVSSLKERAKNKAALQERFGLPQEPNAFLVGIVARLLKQKGFDLLYSTMEPALKELPIQLVLVGEGDPDSMGYFQDLAGKFPGQVAVHLKFDGELPRLIFAGSDAVLVPSRFEPSGLTQMEAMRYGCVPIVRKTGGLADTVENYDALKNTGTGFVFAPFDSLAFLISLVRAVSAFTNKKEWEKLQKRAMKKDFSWENSAKQYAELFTEAVKVHQTVKIIK